MARDEEVETGDEGDNFKALRYVSIERDGTVCGTNSEQLVEEWQKDEERIVLEINDEGEVATIGEAGDAHEIEEKF